MRSMRWWGRCRSWNRLRQGGTCRCGKCHTKPPSEQDQGDTGYHAGNDTNIDGTPEGLRSDFRFGFFKDTFMNFFCLILDPIEMNL